MSNSNDTDFYLITLTTLMQGDRDGRALTGPWCRNRAWGSCARTPRPRRQEPIILVSHTRQTLDKRRTASSVLLSSAAAKSLRSLPLVAWTVRAILTRRSSNSATRSKSASTKEREVSAGVPRRTPPGLSAETSPATEFLLTVMLWHAVSHGQQRTTKDKE